MSEFVASTLKDMGAAGAAISVLLTAVTGCVAAIVYQARQLGALNKERIAETAVLAKLLEANNTALNKSAESNDELKLANQDLADAITKQASAFELVNQRVGFYHEANTDKLKDLREVVSSGAEAIRVHTGIVTEVRNGNINIHSAIVELKQQRRSR